MSFLSSFNVIWFNKRKKLYFIYIKSPCLLSLWRKRTYRKINFGIWFYIESL